MLYEKPENVLGLRIVAAYGAYTKHMQVYAPFPLWLTVLLVIAIAVFTWRVYSSVTQYGWV